MISAGWRRPDLGTDVRVRVVVEDPKRGHLPIAEITSRCGRDKSTRILPRGKREIWLILSAGACGQELADGLGLAGKIELAGQP